MTGVHFDLWTRLIAEHFFNSSHAGQPVRLNVTQELLNSLGKTYGRSSSDFLADAAVGLTAVPKDTENVCQYAVSLLYWWKTSENTEYAFPPFIGYLGLFVYIGTLEEGNDRSYHRRLWSLFPVSSRPTPPSMYPWFDHIGQLWEALEDWSQKTRRRELGVFRLLRLGAYAHVSIPWAQAIMTQEEKDLLPGLFSAGELTPQSPAPPARLKQIVAEFGERTLNARTRRAFNSGGDLEAYVLDDLRRELRKWDGTCRSEIHPAGRLTIIPPRSAELTLFFCPRGTHAAAARLRFESIVSETNSATRYQSESNAGPPLVATPRQGWSECVKAEDGNEFDASTLDWEKGYVWRGSPKGGPRRLNFFGRSVRVFVSATRFGQGGLVEGDQLPASGRCWIAVGPKHCGNVQDWLRKLPSGTYQTEAANLPARWTLVRVDNVPTDLNLRSSFPGGAEDPEPEIWLFGGLRVRVGGKDYHAFAPPRIELGGDHRGIEVFVDDVPMIAVDDGIGRVYELPLSIRCGPVRVQAVRDGITVAEESFALVDVVHAGDPTRVRCFLDGFGHVTSEAFAWCGAWAEAPDLQAFDFRCVETVDHASNLRHSSGLGPVQTSAPIVEPELVDQADSSPMANEGSTMKDDVDKPQVVNPDQVAMPQQMLRNAVDGSVMGPVELCKSVADQIAAVDEMVSKIQNCLPTLGALDAGKDSEVVELTRELVAGSTAARADMYRVCEAAGLSPQWTDRASLLSLLNLAVSRLEETHSGGVKSLLELAEHLELGHVSHHLRKVREKLNEMRHAAALDLRAAASSNARELPGPREAPNWLNWFWDCGDGTEAVVDEVRKLAPALADFLETVTREQWKPGSLEATPQPYSDDPNIRDGSAEASGPRVKQEDTSTTPETERPASDGHGSGLNELPGDSHQVVMQEVELGHGFIQTDTINGYPDETPTSVEQRAAFSTSEGISAADNRKETSSVELQALPILPPALASFEAFRKSHWVTPSGECQLAPWLDSGFGDSITEALFTALQSEQFGKAKVFAAAAQQLEWEKCPTQEEVETWARLWFRPLEAVGMGMDGVLKLRLASGEGGLDSARVWKFRLCLEAVRPSRDLPLAQGEIGEWMDATDFASGALRQMLLTLLRVGRATDRPADEIRRVLNTSASHVGSAIEVFTDARKTFHEEVRRLWTGAGGKIERSHCRRAWDEFISKARAVLETLFPRSEGGEEQWDADEVGRKISRLERLHRDIADRWKAQYHDRHRMDRAARTIAELAARINDMYRKSRVSSGDERILPVSDDEMRTRALGFLTEPRLQDPFEDACRLLIVRQINPSSPTDPKTGLSGADLLEYPALLGCVATDINSSLTPLSAEVVPFDDIVLPAAAAAVFLGHRQPVDPGQQSKHLVDRLASALLVHRRYDVLATLAPRLSPSEQAKIRFAREEVAAETADAFSRLKRDWERLADLASRGESILKPAFKEAAERMRSPNADDSARRGEELIFKEWLTRLAKYADDLCNHELETLKRVITHSAHPSKTAILEAIDDGRLADATYLRNESPQGQISPAAAQRQTAWRGQAAKRFANSNVVLRDYRQRLDPAGRGKGELDDLINSWQSGHAGNLSADRPLRTRFANVVFADTFGGDAEQLRKQGKSEATFFRIPCAKIREHLDRQGLNPCFLPQLAKAEEFVIITPPGRYSDPSLVQQTAALIATSHPNRLVAILAPGMAGELRAALLHELRQRKAMAAVIDSIDFCRLLNPGGRQINLVIGLMEIMLEQQRWAMVSPFVAQDGAQSRIEMYVGRAQEAAILAKDNRYSRLFSGRKLGKSALLKFIEDRYDGEPLASGNTLRVLRIPIVGVQSDAIVISKVLDELKSRLGFQTSGSSDYSTESFLVGLNEFLTQSPAVSLLVILDEADVFIERQLKDFENRKEQCLSFRIRSDAQKEIDSQGLPRIRFVFAGYRKANTRGGAWGNWGDPLLLNPLEADEAAELIGGPLARLGIDASDTAPSIAYRCGYQPAVLLRFGEKLLELLDDRYPDVAERGQVVVTAAHVRDVFDQQAVQDEIRTVVRNNFQGNDAGQAVFSATLMAFAALPPGDALVNAPREIWRRLRELVERGGETVKQAASRIGWLNPRIDHQLEPTEVGLSEVNRHLADFHERKLLTLVNRDDRVYRLRFPYHLSTLLVDVEDEAWNALAGLARTSTSSGDDDLSDDPVNLLALRDLESVLRGYQELGLEDYRAGLLATMWPASVNDRDWMANRFGYDPNQLSYWGQRRDTTARAFLDISPAEAEWLLANRSGSEPPALLTGGADLLRWGLMWTQAGSVLEVHGQRRLTRRAVDRWFRRKREFGFAGDELIRIWELTRGVPFLLELFDSMLQLAVGSEGGVNVGADDFERAVARYEKKLPDHVDRLVNGLESVRLSARERELLLMVVVVARKNKFREASVRNDIQEYWEAGLFEDDWANSVPEVPYPPAYADTLDDRLAARVLSDLGLLPQPLDQTNPQGDPYLTVDDPVARVIAPVFAGTKRSR